MVKKGQVTVFIILAVLIVASVSLYFLVGSTSDEGDGALEQETVSSGSMDVRSEVEGCIKDAGASSIYFISQYGGVFPPEGPHFLGMPYYSYSGELIDPGLGKFESSLEWYFEGAFKNCLGNFSGFSENVSASASVDSDINILEEKVRFSVNYPLTISGRGETRRLEDFESDVEIRLNQIYNASKFIAEQHVQNDGGICLTCMDRRYGDQGFTIQSFSEINNESLQYVIVDNRTIGSRDVPASEDEPLRFMFLVDS